MRRLLTALAAALPLAASAQTSGQILFDRSTTATILRADCQGTGTLSLTWNLAQQVTGDFVPNTGEVNVYAAAADQTSGFPLCHYTGDGSTVTTGLVAGPISNPPSLLSSSGTAVAMADLVGKAGFACTLSDQPIFVCAVWKNGSGVVKAYAKGSVSLKGAIPEPPTVTDVSPGNEALYVTANEGTRVTGDVQATGFKAKAEEVCTAPCTPKVFWSDLTIPIGTTSKASGRARIGGLTNGTYYKVTAVAYADNGSASLESAAWTPDETPVPTLDLWDVYHPIGRDSGGCDAGPAGLLALLSAASLSRIRRRS